MHIKYLLTIFFILFTQLSVISQQWITHLGDSGDDKIISSTTDAAGNIYETGYVTRQSSGMDIAVAKFDINGVLKWVAYYNGPNNTEDKGFGVILDGNNNVLVTGYSTGIGSSTDITTLKYNNNGQLLWTQRYNSTGNLDDKGFGIAVDNLDNVYVTGIITTSTTETDIYTIKYKGTTGEYIWGSIYDGNTHSVDKGFGVIVDQTNNLIYVGGIISHTVSNIDYAVISYDTNGVQRWLQRYDGGVNGTDILNDIHLDNNGSIIVTGECYSQLNDEVNINCVTIKYNSDGTIQWIENFNGSNNGTDRGFGIITDAQNNVFITGSTEENNDKPDYLLIKYSRNGNRSWYKTLDPSDNDSDYAVSVFMPKSQSAVYITGASRTSADNYDIVSAKFNTTNGELLQQVVFSGNGRNNDIPVGLSIDTVDDNITISGYTFRNGSYDWLLCSYSGGQLIKVNKISAEVPEKYLLSQNYPNPFNPTTKIKLELPIREKVKLIVTDVLGKEILNLIDEEMNSGKYEVTVTMNDFSSGIYFYKLIAGNTVITNKMILLK